MDLLSSYFFDTAARFEPRGVETAPAGGLPAAVLLFAECRLGRGCLFPFLTVLPALVASLEEEEEEDEDEEEEEEGLKEKVEEEAEGRGEEEEDDNEVSDFLLPRGVRVLEVEEQVEVVFTLTFLAVVTGLVLGAPLLCPPLPSPLCFSSCMTAPEEEVKCCACAGAAVAAVEVVAASC